MQGDLNTVSPSIGKSIRGAADAAADRPDGDRKPRAWKTTVRRLRERLAAAGVVPRPFATRQELPRSSMMICTLDSNARCEDRCVLPHGNPAQRAVSAFSPR